MIRSILILLVALLLVACGSGPVKRVFPPDVRVQELQIGAVSPVVSLRVQSFSTVPSEVLAYALTLEIAGEPAATLNGTPGIDVLPQAAEVFRVEAPLDAAVLARVQQSLTARTALRYRLHGTITVEPNGRAYPVDYSSALSPVPGLDGVLR